MAPMKHNNNHHNSSNYGEDVNRQANILASCYVGPSGIPEVPSTGLPSPPSSPPLAAITATNELALTPKATRSARHQHAGSGRHHNPRQQHRRGGATSRIRGECERFFCETLRATFLGEGIDAPRVSRLTDVYYNHQQHNDYNNHNYGTGFDGAHGNNNGGRAVVDANGQLTPPDYFPIGDHAVMAARHAADRRMSGSSGFETSHVAAWMEIWDYAGGNSFRAFAVEHDNMGEDRSLFVFFDANVVGRDLKQALVALIELAEGPLGCSHMVIAVDRNGLAEEEERKPLLTGLQWAGFSLTTLDFWTGGVDVTSPRWLFMGMEV
ncbi:ornithine decarboxylase antizyme-domain-containing protein [Coniochaeta sp. 2T2.1]|nr:ornithine decarboxylase antizyme-domain-containing protein [Coniochaeta sp. 2T2.1]